MTATAVASAPSAAPAKNIQLQIHRTYNATPQAIFEAWTRPEMLQAWFGPAHLSPSFVAIDARLGGAYRIDMLACDPVTAKTDGSTSATGVFTVFDPYTTLSFTWNGSWVPGEESLVTIALTPTAAGTELLLTHERFLSEPSRDGHNQGWTASLDKLALLFPAA